MKKKPLINKPLREKIIRPLTPNEWSDLPEDIVQEMSCDQRPTREQAAILKFMEDELQGYINLDWSLVAIYRRMGKHLKRSAASRHLHGLVEKGYLMRIPGQAAVFRFTSEMLDVIRSRREWEIKKRNYEIEEKERQAS